MHERRATQTREINGRGSTREKKKKKASEKLNTDISARRRQKAKRAGLAGVGGESSFRSKICSNCLAGDTDLHWVQIYNSEKSPYHSPLGLLFQAALPGQPMVYDSVFCVKFRAFRRFYDFFLRRKYLESLVRVIRRFGVHMCATKAKKFSGLTFSPAGL